MIRQAKRCLRRWFSRSEWCVRLLGLPRATGMAGERGLLLIQIDGLARRHFERALDEGRMPFLRQLLEEKDYHLHSFYSGLPSSTPAVQGELFYGLRSAVPAFHFVDHESGKYSAMFDPAFAAKREKALANRSDGGLLTGGSSYSNVYTGGAAESHFCTASIGWSNFVRQTNALKLTFVFLSNLGSFVRVGVLMVVELVVALIDALRGIIAGRDLIREINLVPARVAFCVLLRELITIFVRMDLARGVPIIHANLLGYDEQAHRRGPDSRYARWALKGIDRAVARMARASRGSERRTYALWVYSDHGQERSLPYQRHMGKSISQAVGQALVASGLQEITADSAPPLPDANRIVSARRRWPFHWPQTATPAPQPSQDRFRVVARGPIGNLYFERALTLTEKEQLAHALVTTHKVPFILYLDDADEVMAIDAKGKRPFADASASLLGHDHPFLKAVTEDYARLCSHPDAGQLMICGYHAGQASLSFTMENGSHAGPGTDETHAFALLPDAIPIGSEDAPFRPSGLRNMVLRFLGRRSEDRSAKFAKPRSENALQ